VVGQGWDVSQTGGWDERVRLEGAGAAGSTEFHSLCVYGASLTLCLYGVSLTISAISLITLIALITLITIKRANYTKNKSSLEWSLSGFLELGTSE
jgi:hypothetical protein